MKKTHHVTLKKCHGNRMTDRLPVTASGRYFFTSRRYSVREAPGRELSDIGDTYFNVSKFYDKLPASLSYPGIKQTIHELKRRSRACLQ
ncbi:hypothetical protein [Bradyrhizobium sp.]|uniref:hypothetical protein n=1 Tax=Bradyrhizobium sp. TaxID=376 RepID=UPI003C799C95